jgi:hypothetical protein
MADYQYLTPEDQAQIVADVQASVDPVGTLKAAEAAHYRATVEADARGTQPPDPYVPPDVSKLEEASGALDEIAVALPPVLEVAVEGITP